MTDQGNKIQLEDNTDKDPPANTMSKEEEQGSSSDNPLGIQPDAPEKKSWLEQPAGMGNAVGDKIQGTLQPVGNVAGKGFETVAKPVGGLVEPLVGGLMKSGEAFGEQTGVGFGNAGGGPGKQGEARQKELKEGLGGKESNKDNPLGL